MVEIDEAYIHCSKHIPMLQPATLEAEAGRRAGDVFKAKNVHRAWLGEGVVCATPTEPEIGTVTISQAPAPTHAASGRRLPLPVRK